MNYLITGGAGFIGSALIRQLVKKTDSKILNVDKLTYAGNLQSLADIDNCEQYSFSKSDICDARKLEQLIGEFQPDAIINLAAETHVDRSIDGPAEFLQTNIIGTYVLLNQAHIYWNKLSYEKKKNFRFYHISTDEVYGDISDNSIADEGSPYFPSSPYSASKASSDHLVRAWHRTYKLPILISNCSNNFGPYQFPEKLIPLTIINALNYKPLPIYGDGSQIRDWLYVDDHVDAIITILNKGVSGETYNVSGNNEIKNIEVVLAICELLDKQAPPAGNKINSYKELITYVEDRPGHDKRYALSSKKLQQQLNWQPNETFKSGLKKSIGWYLENLEWVESINGKSASSRRLGLNQ